MALKEARRDQAEAVEDTAAEVMAGTKRRLDEFANVQSEFFGKYQQAGRYWLDRVQAEVDLASGFTTKLTAARSVPDAVSVYQEWGRRRFEMMLEDAQHLWHDAQKFTQMGTKGLGA